MTQEKTGGAAFPLDGTYSHGMTLLDYFAAKALVPIVEKQGLDIHTAYVSQAAYKLAAAMIEERKKYTNQ